MNREIKFRVWDGQIMLDPDEATKQGFVLWPDGTISQKMAFGGVPLWYTGMKDKSGAEIYDGDVIEYTYGPVKARDVIQWNEHGFWVKGVDGSLHMPSEEYRTVIGNIFENPDLIPPNKPQEEK